MARCAMHHHHHHLRQHHSSLWIILAISQSVLKYTQGYFLEMMTESQVHVVSEGESISLECQFHADQYNLFDYPVLWRKVQRDEETQMNIMSNVNEPFASSNRFEVSFTSLAPRYRFELSIKDVTQLDSGNYTCDVRGPYSSLLGQSTHYLFVRSNVQSVYIFDPDRTQQPSAKSVRLTEAQATRIRCVAVGGYPPPTVELFLGDERHDVTFRFAYHSSATLSGRRGLRAITYRVERWADAFRVRAEDNGSTLTCVATTPGLPAVSEYAILDVDYTPKLSCSQTSAYLSDKNVHIKCEISARPEATSILWVIDANGTLLAEGQVVNGYWTIIMERADGIVETQLNLGQPRSDSFRQYTLIVENHIGVSKTEVQLSQKFRKSQSPSSKMGQQSDSVFSAANRSAASIPPPPPTSHQQPGHVRHVSDRQNNHESQMDKLRQQQQQQQQQLVYDRKPLRPPTNCQAPAKQPACPSSRLLLLTVPLINASMFVLRRLRRSVLPPFDLLSSAFATQ